MTSAQFWRSDLRHLFSSSTSDPPILLQNHLIQYFWTSIRMKSIRLSRCIGRGCSFCIGPTNQFHNFNWPLMMRGVGCYAMRWTFDGSSWRRRWCSRVWPSYNACLQAIETVRPFFVPWYWVGRICCVTFFDQPSCPAITPTSVLACRSAPASLRNLSPVPLVSKADSAPIQPARQAPR